LPSVTQHPSIRTGFYGKTKVLGHKDFVITEVVDSFAQITLVRTLAVASLNLFTAVISLLEKNIFTTPSQSNLSSSQLHRGAQKGRVASVPLEADPQSVEILGLTYHKGHYVTSFEQRRYQ
jgi:hypothetical protein